MYMYMYVYMKRLGARRSRHSFSRRPPWPAGWPHCTRVLDACFLSRLANQTGATGDLTTLTAPCRIRMCVYIYIYIYIYTHTPISLSLSLSLSIYIYIYIFIYLFITYIFIYIYIEIYLATKARRRIPTLACFTVLCWKALITGP